MAAIRIGISGWRYPPWRGIFYPDGLPQRAELEFTASCFSTIEINGSYYSLQSPASYGAWSAAVPRDFVFSIKAPRFITHIKRLRDIEGPLANFLASGVLRLGAKAGPILWQLPPSLRYDADVLERFLSSLPASTREAAKMAKAHDRRLRWPAWLTIDRSRRLRHALEVRHRSFEQPAFVAQLRRHGVALVVADTAGRWPLLEDLTADFVYVRLHGDAELYASGYTPAALRSWARRVRAWAAGTEVKDARTLTGSPAPRKRGRDVFVYFDNDAKVRAPYDAQSLAHLLGLGPAAKPPARLTAAGEQPRTRWPSYGSDWERAPAKKRGKRRREITVDA